MNRIAVISGYFMSRFNSNLGFQTEKEAFESIEAASEIHWNTVKTSVRDSYDHYFPWRTGWRLNEKAYENKWNAELQEVFVLGNDLSRAELESIVKLFGVWNQEVK